MKTAMARRLGESVLAAVARARAKGVEGIVISLLNAYRNPAHEERAVVPFPLLKATHDALNALRLDLLGANRDSQDD